MVNALHTEYTEYSGRYVCCVDTIPRVKFEMHMIKLNIPDYKENAQKIYDHRE